MTSILVEAFGSIGNNELLKDDIALDDTMAVALQRLNKHPVLDFESVDKIYTGMNGEITMALQDAIDTMGVDVEVQAFYPNVTDIQDEDDISYQEAWKKGFTWRNNVLFADNEDDDEDTVDACIRVGDAGNNGEALLQHARRKGVLAIDINLDDLVNKDEAYGGQEADSSAEAEA